MASWWSEPGTKHAYRLSWVSLVLTVLAAICGISLFVTTGSSLCLVYGLENCVDFLSSAVVLWRFFAPSKVDDVVEAKLRRREERASMAISVVLVLLGFGVIATSMSDFARGADDEGDYQAVIGISFFSFIIFGVLSIFKFRYADRLDSPSLYKDGICSLIGTVLSGALFFDSLLIQVQPDLWWLDPLVALLAGIAAMFIGIKALVATEQPIGSLSWWFMSQGSDTDPSADPTGASVSKANGSGPPSPTSHDEENEEDGDLQTLELTEPNEKEGVV